MNQSPKPAEKAVARTWLEGAGAAKFPIPYDAPLASGLTVDTVPLQKFMYAGMGRPAGTPPRGFKAPAQR